MFEDFIPTRAALLCHSQKKRRSKKQLASSTFLICLFVWAGLVAAVTSCPDACFSVIFDCHLFEVRIGGLGVCTALEKLVPGEPAVCEGLAAASQ